MESEIHFPDGGVMYTTPIEDYLTYIQSPGDEVFIKVGDPIPWKVHRCDYCGSEMSEALKTYHPCGRFPE